MPLYKSIAIWVLFGFMMIFVFNMLETSNKNEEMIFSDFMIKVEQGEVALISRVTLLIIRDSLLNSGKKA